MYSSPTGVNAVNQQQSPLSHTPQSFSTIQIEDEPTTNSVPSLIFPLRPTFMPHHFLFTPFVSLMYTLYEIFQYSTTGITTRLDEFNQRLGALELRIKREEEVSSRLIRHSVQLLEPSLSFTSADNV